ncbi:uncharacterized protein N7473_009625 [Penicillium subrubescens]|uniref:uncharacterized protein n=1 Tax=Penicillium subrubescens TaxID=1316194 RepID=UPI002545801B|nr:uncharacterized protein N7473_009625 [Penicillium subrubescens]KAJ5886951.1 hypothetical protein N7473_009625 [Penicillium subrubescens]
MVKPATAAGGVQERPQVAAKRPNTQRPLHAKRAPLNPDQQSPLEVPKISPRLPLALDQSEAARPTFWPLDRPLAHAPAMGPGVCAPSPRLSTGREKKEGERTRNPHCRWATAAERGWESYRVVGVEPGKEDLRVLATS